MSRWIELIFDNALSCLCKDTRFKSGQKRLENYPSSFICLNPRHSVASKSYFTFHLWQWCHSRDDLFPSEVVGHRSFGAKSEPALRHASQLSQPCWVRSKLKIEKFHFIFWAVWGILGIVSRAVVPNRDTASCHIFMVFRPILTPRGAAKYFNKPVR